MKWVLKNNTKFGELSDEWGMNINITSGGYLTLLDERLILVDKQ